MSQIKEFIQQHQARFLEDLFALIRIPSVSAKSEHKSDMQRCAEHWRDHLRSLGVQTVEIYQTAGNPIVFGHYELDPKLPTILVYAHYDVMPPEPLELWKSEPFVPEVRDGHIWARGADDDKGQSMIQVKGFETALALGLVRCNVKFLFEGEEEIGSTHLEQFCREHLEMLSADNIIVSDTSMVSAETPSLTTGLRGLAYWQIEVTGANHDLHSGHFGGAVANPINELCKLIAQVQDADGRITIPHFYDAVVDLTDEERAMIAQIPFDEEQYKKFLEVSCRLVANQDHHQVSQAFIDYIKSIAPKYVRVEVTPMHGGEAYLCPIDLPAYKAAEEAVGVAFGKRPLAVRRGGSIPIIAAFERVFGIKTILMGFGLESNAIHSPNENMPLDAFYKGIEAVAEFYKIYPQH